MVIRVAAYPSRNYFCIYNSARDEYQQLYFYTNVREWEIEKIDDYFENIVSVVQESIDDFYLLLYEDYHNKIRKHFMQVSKKHGIKQLYIINMHRLVAISALKHVNSHSDTLWLFRCTIHELQCGIWEKNNLDKLIISTIIVERRTSSNPDLFGLDLQNLKNKLPASTITPTIFVFQSIEKYPENIFREIFNTFPKINFYNGFSILYDLLYIIQLQHKKLVHYMVQPMLGRKIDIKLNETYVKTFLQNCAVPFKEKYQLYAEENNMFLKIFENECLTKTINISERGIIILNFEIDENGIFNLKVNRKMINFDTFLCSKSKLQNKNIFQIPSKLLNYNKELNAVGIDFGSAECCAFVIRRNGPDGVLTDPITTKRTLPFYIAINELNYPCGQNFVNRMERDPNCLAFDVKHLIGKQLEEIVVNPLWTFDVINYCEQIHLIFYNNIFFQRRRSCIEILSYILKQIKEKVEEYQGTRLKEAVITIPASFNEKQKDATIDAANIAGWLKVHLLPEPIAAIIAYSYENELPNESVALVFDCGGRTTQICVAKMIDNKIEILTNNEDPFLGGNDFDRRLITYFSSALKHKYGLNVFETNERYRLMNKCQEIKHTLSVELKDNLYVDDFKVYEDDVISIERKEFEEMAADLILRAKHLIVESLSKAKLKRENINIVFQVGGGCRMPMIKGMLKEMFPRAQHQCSIHPEEIVAKGAALYSYEIKSRNQIDSHVPKNIVIVKDDDLDVGDSHASVSSTDANPENYLLKDEQQRNTRQLFS